MRVRVSIKAWITLTLTPTLTITLTLSLTKDIESTILKLLSESEGNILDDEGLINTLAQSKVTSNEIAVKAEEAAKTEVVIDQTRNEYRPVAFRGALLFFCVADMGKVTL